MARLAVNGIALNVEVWPSPPGPPSPFGPPSPPDPWLTGPLAAVNGPARLSLPAGEGEPPIKVSASVLSPRVQWEGVGRDTSGCDTGGGLPSPASGRAEWAVGPRVGPRDQSAWGGGEGRPTLLLLHGFTGSAASWRGHVATLTRYATVVAVDLIGHGNSDAPADPARYTMAHCIADLLAALDHLGIAHVVALGYSMGARVALRLAAAAPDRVAALILESGSPGLATEEEREARRAADAALATRIEQDGVDKFVDYWEAIPLFATQRGLPAPVRDRLRRQRLRNSATGLANSLRGMGTGTQEPLWDRLGTIMLPALLVAGALDEKFCVIGCAMAAAMPRADLAVVPGAGHTTHVEQPAEFDQLVTGFLQSQGNVWAQEETGRGKGSRQCQ